MINFNTQKQKGFTLLFSILVSTLIVSIGATIISISLRQTILSSTSRESQFAFYAANTALECAFFWDNIILDGESGKVFPIGTEVLVSDTDSIRCAGGNIITGSGFTNSFRDGAWNQSSESTNFRIVISDTSVEGIEGMENIQTCAEVSVDKELDANGVVSTRINARGYNTCDITNPRAVERGLYLEYES